jgi:hypothetical protein
MTNEEHLALLQQGITIWNDRRIGNQDRYRISAGTALENLGAWTADRKLGTFGSRAAIRSRKVRGPHPTRRYPLELLKQNVPYVYSYL